MHTHDHPVKPEYARGIMKVLHYINLNLAGDVSLETLAAIANYSPFHFQKVFSAAMNVSPKQYVVRLRLERAAHYLKVFPTLPIVEIAMGCGFSSPSVFSRAFRNYYAATPEEFRNMPVEESAALSLRDRHQEHITELDHSYHWADDIGDPIERSDSVNIDPPPSIKSVPQMTIAFYQTTLSHPENISFAFKSLLQWAIPNEKVLPGIRFTGIWLDVPFYTSPDKCRYLAGIELKGDTGKIRGMEVLTMNAGKYAVFNMTGNLESTLNNLLALNHKYLFQTGYEVAEIICYEIFDECPADKGFDKVGRSLMVPVRGRIRHLDNK